MNLSLSYLYRRSSVMTRRLFRQPRWRRIGIVVGKALAFQVISGVATFLLVVGLTENVTVGVTISLAEFFGKMLLYVLFELGWINLRIRL